MRKILLFIAAFLLALISMPFVFGLITEHRIKATLAEADLPEGTLVEIKTYKLGYLQSHALINVALVEPQNPLQPTQPSVEKFSFNIEGDIHHGPFFKTSEGYAGGLAYLHFYVKPTDLALSNEGLAKIIGAIFTDKEVVSLDASFSYLGNMTAHLHSSPANYQGNDGAINWGGVNGHFKMAGNRNAINVNIEVAPLLMQSSTHAALDFAKITLTSNAKRTQGLPWVGEQSLLIPSFYMKDEQNKELRFDNLNVKAVTNLEDSVTQMNFDAKADSLEIFSQKIDSLNLNLAISQLEAKSFVKFSEQSQTDMNLMSDEDKKEFTRTVIQMLSPGTHFVLQHNMNIHEGPVTSNIDIKFPKLTDELNKEPNEVLAQRLLKDLNASVALSTPKIWLENTLYNMSIAQIPANAPPIHDPVSNQKITPQEMVRRQLAQQMKSFTQAGILATDGQHYSFNLNYNQGQFTLNGKALSQEEMGQLINSLSH